jgi:hypothetical protein
MEKEFVPYELALKIKQIGYKKEGVDEDCFAFYDEEEYLFTVREQDDINEEWLIAPTFSQAFRWFREEYDLHYQLIPFFSDKESHAVDYYLALAQHRPPIQVKTFEEAELACLEKLIEIVEQTNAEMTDHGVYK